jgi:hypothetical protein
MSVTIENNAHDSGESTPSSSSGLSILSRVYSIPLVASSVNTINEALSNNAYTRSPYSAAVGISSTAYKYVEPLQARLPLRTIDDYANKVMDAVESRYPYPFHAKPEEVADYLRQQRENVYTTTNKTLDEKVKSPAYQMASGIDQRFTPVVDYFQVAVDRLDHEGNSHATDESKYQYQRAYNLSHRLKDQIYIYSNDQLKHLQAQNALVQRATETAHNVQALASSSISHAQTRVHDLSESMLATLHKLQASTSSSASQIQSQLSPPQIQKSYQEISAALSSTIMDVRGILAKKDATLQEKVSLMATEVGDRVSPLLSRIRKVIAGKEAAIRDSRDPKQKMTEAGN